MRATTRLPSHESARPIPDFLRPVETAAAPAAAPESPPEPAPIETVPMLVDKRVSWPALLTALVQAGFVIQNDGHGNIFVTQPH